jgi:NitT/TauT family transport system substrate-binding protein
MKSIAQEPSGAKQPRQGRRRWLLAGASGVVTLAWPGCAMAQALTEVNLSVPGPRDSVSAPLELAVKLGADKAEGIALRLKFVDGGGVAIQDLDNGNASYAVFGVPAALNSNARQNRLVVLAAINDLPLYTLMVRADLRDRIRRVRDLRGRVIGIHSNSLATRTTSHQMADLLLRNNGLTPADVNYVAAGQNWETQSSAFIGRTVDASMCDEPFGTRLASEKLAFALYSTGDPADALSTPGAGFLRAALMARRDVAQANPGLCERMVAMVRRSLAWMASHKPEEVADLLGLVGTERSAFVQVARKFPRQYSTDARFSRAQLRETEIFTRATDPDNTALRAYPIDAMILDRWAGTKP